MKKRGFALATTMVLTVVLASIAWAMLEFSSSAYLGARFEEPRMRCFHAAEAGVRYFLAYGEASNFELNDCEVEMQASPTELTVTARHDHGFHRIKLALADGYVVRRTSSAR